MIKLFTHTDLDGIGCAILAKLAFGENVDVAFCNYDDINSRVEEFFSGESKDCCHITDISIGEDLADKIDKSDASYLLLDHHPTALNLNKYKWCSVKIENEHNGETIKTSGTELYYQYLVHNNYLRKTDTLDRFVELVRDYDTWRWASLGDDGIICKKVNNLLYLYGYDKFIEWCLHEIQEEVFPKLYEADTIVLDIKQKEIDSYIETKNKQMITCEVANKVCGIVFAERYTSELGNKLCQLHPEIDFIAMIDMGNKTVSYRAVKDDIDLGSDIAKLFGGGGHPKAAGSQFSDEIPNTLIKEIFGNN